MDSGSCPRAAGSFLHPGLSPGPPGALASMLYAVAANGNRLYPSPVSVSEGSGLGNRTVSQLWESGQVLESGGAVSGVLAFVFVQVFSKIGSIVIFIVGALLMLLAVFNRTVVELVDAARNRPRWSTNLTRTGPNLPAAVQRNNRLSLKESGRSQFGQKSLVLPLIFQWMIRPLQHRKKNLNRSRKRRSFSIGSQECPPGSAFLCRCAGD